MTKLPQQVKEYLNERGISDAVIEKSQIAMLNNDIAIPIFTETGTHLFNKYRKDPFTYDDRPKYRYDRGSTLTLFNKNNIPEETKDIYITEGELDCLALMSAGYNVVSGTGGAGSFDRSWASYFKKFDNVYICYDADDAGIKGTINVKTIIPDAKVIWLPRGVYGKDVTDFLKTFGKEEFQKLADKAENLNIPVDPVNEPILKGELEKTVKMYKALAQVYLNKEKELKYTREGDWHPIEVVREHLLSRAHYYQQRRDHFDYVPQQYENQDLVQRAKTAQPISAFIQFNRMGFAKCLWHDEGSASLKYYPNENRVYCYGGCGHKDVIDVVMAVEGVDFTSALKFLNK